MPHETLERLRVEEVTSAGGLEALRGEWAALWPRVPEATPFQAPDWLIPWWRRIGEGELLTPVLRTPCGALAGLAPLYLWRSPDGHRSLFPLGIATTDYLDAVIAPEHRQATLRALSAWLASRRHLFDVAEWPQLRPGAALLDLPAPPGWTDELGPAEPCPVLPLRGTIDATVPAEQLESFRRRIARAGRRGELLFERADDTNADDLLEAHLRLHAARWERRGEDGVLAPDGVQAMHRESLPGLLRAGTLRLHALRIGGRIAATLHAVADPAGRAARRIHFYLGGFDPHFERLSPGMLIVGHAIADALEEGAVAVDFLRGQERHKYLWGAEDTRTWRRVLRPPA